MAQLALRAEADLGGLEPAVALDPHRARAVDHHLVDRGVAKERLQGTQAERLLGDQRGEPSTGFRVQQGALAVDQRRDPPTHVAVHRTFPRLVEQPGAQSGGQPVELVAVGLHARD